ncbi:exodeoxyribonuclease VII small subunit [Chelatococcus sambhunathii]|uniref:Exodeoxyribonuclease 7 small subunit n=1 Tax=Chelatococcus sambhunathii TaxID=363953 RepID=A0ABU1DII9_9HYPH|nr:exodeoxyribonuclease VII small subunit [Chelatococcus sambhunathii]MDR4307928.1 exodeoxyribonuclease VII small subunit [Chelatococcus sambhunathii]
MTDAPPDLSTLSFEAALSELEKIVARLEQGQVPLEESIAIYQRGEALKARCDELLKRAEARVETITVGADGTPTGLRPLDPQ